VVCLGPRDPVDIAGPRLLSGVVGRPLNFTVRRFTMKSLWRELSIGAGVAAIVSLAVQSLEPVLSILSPLLVLPVILFALGVVWNIPTLRPSLGRVTVPAALVAGILINYLPYPAGSLGARISFYAQLVYYKDELDAQCARTRSCHDTLRVTTTITAGFGSIIQGIARDDSGALLSVGARNRQAPIPLTGCENGIVHLCGPYFHFACG
jgi:hypothetical protein